jgi:hypothetical protein
VGIETTLTIISILLAVLTTISAEWIEELTGFEPDAGSGALEFGLPIVFAVAAVTFALLARHDLRRLRAATR